MSGSGKLWSSLGIAAATLAMSLGAASAQPFHRTGVEAVQYRQDDYRDQRRYDDPRAYRPEEQRGSRPEEQRGYRQEDPRGYRQDDRDQRQFGDRRGRSETPGGSYMQSCGEAQLQGSTLTAICRGSRGNRSETSLDVTRCGRSDIVNNNGTLQCGGTRGSARRAD